MKNYKFKYDCNCNECGQEWEEYSNIPLTYEDTTCPCCEGYESIFMELKQSKQ